VSTALQHAISVVLILSYSDIFVRSSTINCILITQNAFTLYTQATCRTTN
jgi:hypothetical protein